MTGFKLEDHWDPLAESLKHSAEKELTKSTAQFPGSNQPHWNPRARAGSRGTQLCVHALPQTLPKGVNTIFPVKKTGTQNVSCASLPLPHLGGSKGQRDQAHKSVERYIFYSIGSEGNRR